MKQLSMMSLLWLCVFSVCAQTTESIDPDYRKVMYERAEGIVKELKIKQADKRQYVLDLIAEQYIELGKINDGFKDKVKALKESGLPKEERERLSEMEYFSQRSQLYARHNYFVSQLNANLTPAQVEIVKDGMSLKMYPWTLNGFLEMIPSLTDEEKAYIRALLMEAREYAMDCSDSKTKQAWFAKYKGRINNYLSKRGYDLKQEREAWNERNNKKKKH